MNRAIKTTNKNSKRVIENMAVTYKKQHKML
uniref:Uncharacterized protein n=1 Tax=Rhizophora mucronata TaxID=61149 RepID=A0A2P2R1E6_RHIMU